MTTRPTPSRSHPPIRAALLLFSIVLTSFFGSFLRPFDGQEIGTGPALAGPGRVHLMGTDELGRDVFNRVLSGTRVSLFVGVSAALAAGLAGIAIGAFAGFSGGFTDDVLMRVTEMFQIIPRFFLAMMLVAFFGPSVLNVVLAIALLSWPQLARVVRAEFLTLKSRDYVEAARAAGAGRLTLIFAKILPNALGPAMASGTLLVAQAILIEAGLSYLGLGDPSRVSLGLILQEAQPIMRTAWWTTAFPGFAIFATVITINTLGEGLSERWQPRTR